MALLFLPSFKGAALRESLALSLFLSPKFGFLADLTILGDFCCEN